MNYFRINHYVVESELSAGLRVQCDTERLGENYVIVDIATGRVKARSELTPVFGIVDDEGNAQYGWEASFDLRKTRRLQASKRAQKIAVVEETMAEIRSHAFRACQSLHDRGIVIPRKLIKLANWPPIPMELLDAALLAAFDGH